MIPDADVISFWLKVIVGLALVIAAGVVFVRILPGVLAAIDALIGMLGR